MKLVLSSSKGTHQCAWAAFALIRDNVQHYLEHGQPGRFVALHQLENAVDNGSCLVDGARLRSEVLKAVYALSDIALSDAAVSLRSYAILTGSSQPAVRGTVNARAVGWRLPVQASEFASVTSAAHAFVKCVLDLTRRRKMAMSFTSLDRDPNPGPVLKQPIDAVGRAGGRARVSALRFG